MQKQWLDFGVNPIRDTCIIALSQDDQTIYGVAATKRGVPVLQVITFETGRTLENGDRAIEIAYDEVPPIAIDLEVANWRRVTADEFVAIMMQHALT